MEWVLIVVALGAQETANPISLHDTKSECIIQQHLEMRRDELDRTYACPPVHILPQSMQQYIYRELAAKPTIDDEPVIRYRYKIPTPRPHHD